MFVRDAASILNGTRGARMRGGGDAHFGDYLLAVALAHPLKVELLPRENLIVSLACGTVATVAATHQSIRFSPDFSDDAKGPVADNIDRFVEFEKAGHDVRQAPETGGRDGEGTLQGAHFDVNRNAESCDRASPFMSKFDFGIGCHSGGTIDQQTHRHGLSMPRKCFNIATDSRCPERIMLQ